MLSVNGQSNMNCMLSFKIQHVIGCIYTVHREILHVRHTTIPFFCEQLPLLTLVLGWSITEKVPYHSGKDLH